MSIQVVELLPICNGALERIKPAISCSDPKWLSASEVGHGLVVSHSKANQRKVRRCPGSGHLRVSTRREEQVLHRVLLEDPFCSASQLKVESGFTV